MRFSGAAVPVNSNHRATNCGFVTYVHFNFNNFQNHYSKLQIKLGILRPKIGELPQSFPKTKE